MNRATLAHSGISATLLYLIKSWQGCRPCSSPVLGKEGKSSATARDANAAEQACCPAKQGGLYGKNESGDAALSGGWRTFC